MRTKERLSIALVTAFCGMIVLWSISAPLRMTDLSLSAVSPSKPVLDSQEQEFFNFMVQQVHKPVSYRGEPPNIENHRNPAMVIKEHNTFVILFYIPVFHSYDSQTRNFIISHEFGHIYYNHLRHEGSTLNEQIQADTFALSFSSPDVLIDFCNAFLPDKEMAARIKNAQAYKEKHLLQY
ncbi:hypothetical protein KW791_01070 [Candidatus Parcubacteria bacterium]|nr:hypothetical protein [Candidatus Parcubacteria bacterium]